MSYRVETPDQLVITSFAARAINGSAGVLTNAWWSLKEYAQVLDSMDVDGLGMMWEPIRPSISAAQRQIDTQEVAGYEKYLVAVKEPSRTESTLLQILWSRRALMNAAFAIMQGHRLSTSAATHGIETARFFQQLHPNQTIPFRVYGEQDGRGLSQVQAIPNKVFTFELAKVIGPVSSHTEDVHIESIVDLVTETMKGEGSVIGIDLNPRDIFAALAAHGKLAIPLIEALLQSGQGEGSDRALVQTVSLEPHRGLDQKDTVSDSEWSEVLVRVKNHFKGTIIISPGAGTLVESVQTVAQHLRS